ncbi:hypothetical protein GQ600_10002 [Phytophthora cactorum]|nr:hypothetical protein GQ600_10002 [Phytophthora cactorum]
MSESVVLPPTPSDSAPLDGVAADDITPTSLLPRLRKKGYKFSCAWLAGAVNEALDGARRLL